MIDSDRLNEIRQRTFHWLLDWGFGRVKATEEQVCERISLIDTIDRLLRKRNL